MKGVTREALQQLLRNPQTSWRYLAVAAGLVAGGLALYPVMPIVPDAPMIVFVLVWLVVAAPVAVWVGIRLERFANGSSDEKEAEE